MDGVGVCKRCAGVSGVYDDGSVQQEGFLKAGRNERGGWL